MKKYVLILLAFLCLVGSLFFFSTSGIFDTDHSGVLQKNKKRNAPGSLNKFGDSILQNHAEEVPDVATSEVFLSSTLDLSRHIPSQTFAVDLSKQKKVELKCDHGTKVTFTSDVFGNADGSELCDPTITVSVKEAFALHEIIFANLTTLSDDRLLESKGMIYIEANADGQPLKLKDGKSISVQFPTAIPQDFQLFYGNNQNGNVNWTPANNWAGAPVINTYALLKQDPLYEGGKDSLEAFFRRNIDYFIMERIAEKPLNGECAFSFTIDKTGQVKKTYFSKSLDIDMNKEILRAFKKMKRWKPGIKKYGDTVDVRMFCVLNFSRNNYSIALTDMRHNEFCTALPLNSGKTKYRIENVAFSASRMGWLNCDRFMNDVATRDILVENSEENNGSRMYLILKSSRSVIPATLLKKNIVFRNVPLNSSAIVVAIKEEGERLFTACKELNVVQQKNIVKDLRFINMSPEDFVESMKKYSI